MLYTIWHIFQSEVLKTETIHWCLQPDCWLLRSTIGIDQLKAKDKWDQEVMLTASEDRYEILTEVKCS